MGYEDQRNADLSRGYRNEESEDEHEIYDEEYGWVTPEELEYLTSQIHEKAVKITKTQLRRIIHQEQRKLIKESDQGPSPVDWQYWYSTGVANGHEPEQEDFDSHQSWIMALDAYDEGQAESVEGRYGEFDVER